MALDEVKGYLIGVIMFIVVITGGIIAFSSFTAYDSSIDATNQIGQFNTTFNKATEMTVAVDGIKTSVTEAGSSSSGPLGWLNALVGSAYNGLKALSGATSFVDVAATDSANFFNIPFILPLITLITLVITIIIGFGIWSAITKT